MVLELTGRCFESFGSGLLVTTVYRQPSADIGTFLSDLQQYIHSTTVSQSNHILLGDINIDTCKTDAVSTNYLNILSSAHFINTIQIPTRINSCLDHININFFDKFITSGTVCTSIADHLPTFLKIENLTEHFAKIVVTKKRNYRNFNGKKLFIGHCQCWLGLNGILTR